MKEISPTVFKRRKKGKGIGGGEEGKEHCLQKILAGQLQIAADFVSGSPNSLVSGGRGILPESHVALSQW